MQSRTLLTVLALLWLPPSSCLVARAAAPDSCATPDSSSSVPAGAIQVFYPYRSGQEGFDLRWRDLELCWDARYPGGLSNDARATLDNFAKTLVEQFGSNPFGIPVSDFHLVYDYFRYQGMPYNTSDPRDSTSVKLGHPLWAPDIESYNNADRSHADHYLWDPARDLGPDGQYPSPFTTVDEDVTTGHSTSDYKTGNSLGTEGPKIGEHLDLTGTGWTKPNQIANVLYCHEFQHSFPGQSYAGILSEMFSAAAEAVAGNEDTTATSEVPYTWSLLASSPFSSDLCANPRGQRSNYIGRSLFTAYLAYTFRGQDTSPTISSISDDLLRKWAQTPLRRLSDLRGLLNNTDCWDCAQKNYFRAPDGSPLPEYDRFQLLLHNWRVANYVNQPAFAEGQYGYPAAIGFAPSKQFKAWQDFDNCGLDDLVAMPPVVTLSSVHTTREATFVGWRSFGGNTYPLRLQPLGSEYWVVRADTASLGTAPRDLVVRVTPEAIYRCGGADGRLVASVVAYTLRAPDPVESPQWANPSWAQLAVAPKWVDVDSVAGEAEFVVPGFGTTYKAAVVVISLGDGPSRSFELRTGLGYTEALPYRLTLALRGAPADTVASRQILATAGYLDDAPAWSPAGDELVVQSINPSVSSYQQIYRKKLDATPPSRIAPQSQHQYEPDWSPRGDLVAFAQDGAGAAPGQRDIWLVATSGGATPGRLTYQEGFADNPVFQPNGQRIAYVWRQTIYLNGPDPPYMFRWQLRRVNIDGTSDVPLTGLFDWEIRSPRWSPDGKWVYFARNDSLFAVASSGGLAIPRNSVVGKVSTFDFHRGTGRFLAEQPGGAQPIACTLGTPLPFRRVALVDTTLGARDTLVRFYRTGAEFYGPRYSFDGTRIAYSSNQNLVSDRDIFVGQVSYNHPPVFNGLGDQFLEACCPFVLDLNATDPDGESVTYAAAYLPTGSSLSGNRFTWNHPQVGEYWVVFRALDGSGDNRVVYFNVIEGGCCMEGRFAGGGEGGGGSALPPEAEGTAAAPAAGENSLFEGAATGEPTWDAIRLPAPSGAGAYRAWMRAGSTRSASLDALLLLVVDHDPSVAPCLLGRDVVLGRQVAATSARLEDGADVTAALGGMAAEFLRVGAGGSVTLTLPNAAGPLLLEARRLGATDQPDASGIRVQVPDVVGWRTVGQGFPRVGFDQAAVDCGSATEVRLAILSDAELRFAGRLARSSDTPTVRWAVLESARDAKLGDVKSAVASPDGAGVGMTGPDTLGAEFTLPPLAAGQGRDCFLWVEATLQAGRAAGAGNSLAIQAALPTEFALFQNQPNPFGERTAIHFALPAPRVVRLEIFDVLGRRVRLLADQPFPAGYQAIEWDRRDEVGGLVTPGIYLYRMQAGEFRDRRKMVLLPQ